MGTTSNNSYLDINYLFCHTTCKLLNYLGNRGIRKRKLERKRNIRSDLAAMYLNGSINNRTGLSTTIVT